jgi:hypothetical protein
VSEANGTSLKAANAATVGILATIRSGANEWYRVTVQCGPELGAVNMDRLDKYQQNELQVLNVVVRVVVNNEVKYVLSPPNYVAGTTWDIGFVNALNGEMMLINAFRSAPPQDRLELCNEYFSFYGYLSKKANLRSILGTSCGLILQASIRPEDNGSMTS